MSKFVKKHNEFTKKLKGIVNIYIIKKKIKILYIYFL